MPLLIGAEIVKTSDIFHAQWPTSNIQGKTEIPKGLRALLDDGTSPTYGAWEHLMRANLRTYEHAFYDQISILDHVFAQTTGVAMNYLTQKMNHDHPQTFTHEEEMFDWLKRFFKVRTSARLHASN